MPTSDADLDKIERQLHADGIEHLLVQFVDIHGAAKVKIVPAKALRPVAHEGAGFAGGAVWGSGQGPHSHDLCARIDLDSYTKVPYEPTLARFASDLHVDGKPHPFCPRANLRRVLDAAKFQGYRFNVGIEPEFFLVTKQPDGSIRGWNPRDVDDLKKPCYDYKSMSAAYEFLSQLMRSLNQLGWNAYQADHEDANSQYEINFEYADALTTADRLTFFRMMTAELATKFNAVATFMAKPYSDKTGSGAHMHFHLADAKTGDNILVDENDARGLGLSKTAYHFLGGVLKHAKALTAIGSPTVNCFKRLQFGQALTGSRSGFTWVPAFITYGDNNRTQMLRVCGPGHIEDRSISSACNPYLVLAAYLTAGLDGIDNAIEPGEPNLGNLYETGLDAMKARGIGTLPQSLGEALDHLEADEVVRSALGPIADEFLKLKRDEFREYHADVSPWEVRRYLTAL